MKPQCVADIEGPWHGPEWDSSLIERCRQYWTTPIKKVPDYVLATFLNQRFALDLVIAEASARISTDRFDGTELFDGQLAESLNKATNN